MCNDEVLVGNSSLPHSRKGKSNPRILILAALILLPITAAGQEPPLSPCSPPQPAAKLPPQADSTPQFYDEPQFTVAGVKDASQTGGHGSDTVRRTTESLTKETAALSGPAKEAAQKPEAAERKDDDINETSLRAALAKDPSNPANRHALAEAEEKAGHSLEAVQEFQRAAELDASETNLFDWGAELLLHRAYEPAGEVFTKGRRMFPASVRMAVGLGVAAYALDSYDAAAQRLCEASDLSPTDATPYLFLGKLQAVDSGAFPFVLERLDRFVRIQPTNAWASYYDAVALWKRREEIPEALQRAEALLRRAVELDPKMAVAYLQLGIMDSERKNWSGALAALQNAVKIDPEMEEGHFRLANAYRRNSQLAEAKAELDVYERIAKENNGKAERERAEISQFVYASRTPAPTK